MPTLVKPPRLKQGDTIGLISPSWCGAGMVPHRYKNGIKNLFQLGFRTLIGAHTLDVTGYTAGSAIERAHDINTMFANKQVKAIMCTIGGDHSNQVIPYLNWDIIKKNPKIFIGYSDATVLHLAFYTQAKLITFYGPCLITQFGEYPNILEYSKNYFLKATVNSNPIGKIVPSSKYTDEVMNWFDRSDLKRPRKLSSNIGFEWLRGGHAQGILLGGCLPSLMHLRGTKYWPSFDKKLLFLEIPEGESIYHGLKVETVDSLLADLELSQVFEGINALIIGKIYRYNREDNELLKQRILAITKKYSFPILYNVNFGHTDPIITIPYGIKATLNSDEDEFYIKESALL